MNILYTINSAKKGGAEQHVLDLVKGMVSRGHKVYICCPDGPLVAEYKTVGIREVFVHPIKFDIDPLYISRLVKILKEKATDVVHAHELKAVVNTLIAAKLVNTKVKVTHSHTPISEWQISNIKKFINVNFFYTPFVNLFSSAEIALTQSRKKVKIAEGIKENKLRIIPNGLDTTDFPFDRNVLTKSKNSMREKLGIDKDAFVFGYLGRISPEKGIDVLLTAFQNFLHCPQIDKENTYLLVAGGGVLLSQTKKLAQKLNISEQVIFTDTYPEEDKTALYSALDTFVFPSLAEGFGLVLIEAMAMSLPVIASDLEVLQEVGGSSVIFFDTGNFKDLSEKMFNMYQKRDRLDNLKLENRTRVEELFGMKNFIDSYENLYLELLENTK
jgi:glycosyltransferase involved in cell wall biosynthesis